MLLLGVTVTVVRGRKPVTVSTHLLADGVGFSDTDETDKWFAESRHVPVLAELGRELVRVVELRRGAEKLGFESKQCEQKRKLRTS